MTEAYICDAVRTPIGRYGGSLSSLRTDDLGALPIKALIERNTSVDWQQVNDVIMGCANQSGEDNRNVARMSGLLAGLGVSVPGTTINRLCGSGLDAMSMAARTIKTQEADIMIAGGVEGMSRSPYVVSKSDTGFGRGQQMFDTTMGWRFVNRQMKAQFGIDSMPETAENVAQDFGISRADQDQFALSSQLKAAASQKRGFFEKEIIPVSIPQRKKDPIIFDQDEHLRPSTSLEALAKLPTPFRENGSVTAGNASGINDGACAMLLTSEVGLERYGLTPRVRVIASSVSGLEPRIMGVGPVNAVKKVLKLTGLTLDQMDLIELNEAFAAQALAVIRSLNIDDGDPRLNPNGGAIALGHPLGMSGARLATTAINQLEQSNGRFALCTMCIGVGQGIASIIERV